MKKQYGLLLAIFYLFCTTTPANLEPVVKKYDDAKTKELQKIVDKMHDWNQAALASKVTTLVRAHADPNLCVRSRCVSLVQRYVKYDNGEVVTCLLNHKANPDSHDGFDNMSPLFYAKSPSMAQLLLDRGANVHLRARYNQESALQHIAFHGKKGSAHVLAILCGGGGDPDMVNGTMRNALARVIASVNVRAHLEEQEQLTEDKKKAGVLYWYSKSMEYKSSQPPSSIGDFLEKISVQKADALQSLASLLTSTLNGATVLGTMIADYSGAPGLTLPDDINAWDELIKAEEIHYAHPRERLRICKPCILQ